MGEGTAAPPSLTFAPSAWNAVQTVTGVRDTVDDGDATWTVRLDPSSGDTDYDGGGDVAVSLTAADDDGPPGVALALSSTSISETGGVSTGSAPSSGASSDTVTVAAAAGSEAVAGDFALSTAATPTIAAGRRRAPGR